MLPLMVLAVLFVLAYFFYVKYITPPFVEGTEPSSDPVRIETLGSTNNLAFDAKKSAKDVVGFASAGSAARAAVSSLNTATGRMVPSAADVAPRKAVSDGGIAILASNQDSAAAARLLEIKPILAPGAEKVISSARLVPALADPGVVVPAPPAAVPPVVSESVVDGSRNETTSPAEASPLKTPQPSSNTSDTPLKPPKKSKHKSKDKKSKPKDGKKKKKKKYGSKSKTVTDDEGKDKAAKKRKKKHGSKSKTQTDSQDEGDDKKKKKGHKKKKSKSDADGSSPQAGPEGKPPQNT